MHKKRDVFCAICRFVKSKQNNQKRVDFCPIARYNIGTKTKGDNTMKEIAIQYLQKQADAGVKLVALATKTTMRVFDIKTLAQFIDRQADNTLLREHDGIRLKPLNDNTTALPIKALFGKALYSFPLRQCTASACEAETAEFFHGTVTGGNSDCPWDVETEHGVKVQVKGIGGLMME